MVDRAGFEPATSTLQAVLRVSREVVDDFGLFCLVQQRLAPSTSRDHRARLLKFLRWADFEVSRDKIQGYLETYVDKSPGTYNRQLDTLRVFCRDFLKMGHLIEGFKYSPRDDPEPEPPSDKAIQRGFYAQPDRLSQGFYLFVATTGLRKSEILGLSWGNINLQLRSVKPGKWTRTKRTGVTFYNCEAERLMPAIGDDPIWPLGSRTYNAVWKRATKAAGEKISAKLLRVWFSTKMAELGVPDRYVDVFQGRAPRKVIAKYYTGKGLLRLKRIYDRAGLRVLP